jgi:hypothetical protein
MLAATCSISFKFKCHKQLYTHTNIEIYIIYCSWYSDWLQPARQRGRSLSPSKGKTVLYSTASIPALGSTQPPIQRVPGALYPRVKRQRREAEHLPQTSAEGQKYIGSIHPLPHTSS